MTIATAEEMREAIARRFDVTREESVRSGGRFADDFAKMCFEMAKNIRAIPCADPLTAALALPEIRALVEALNRYEYQLGGETEPVKRRFADVRSFARAALQEKQLD